MLISVLFLHSGAEMALNPVETVAFIASSGAPWPKLGYVTAVCVELAGAAMLISGRGVRTAATTLALFTLATAFLFHADMRDAGQLTHFLKNFAIADGLIVLAATEWKCR